jgi:RecA/RadA recombinase
MSSAQEVLKKIKKDHGQSIATMGNEHYADTPRIPTGIFPFDLASGGGFPMGRVSIVYGPESSNKCHEKGTKILMFDGSMKNVEDIVAGDKVMGVDSTPRTVQQSGTGFGKLYKVTPVKGNDPFVINGEHVLSLVCTHDQGLRKKEGVVNISLNDYMQKSNDWKIYHHLYRVGVEFPEANVPLSPYFLGLWLGDGSSDRPIITTADEPIVDWLQGFADNHGWELRTYTANSRCPMYGVVGVRQGNAKEGYTVPMDLLRGLGVIGNKHVPSGYKVNSRRVRLQVLAGLLDSDGNKGSGGSMGFVNTNKILCEDVLFLARSLGLYASMTTVSSTYEGEPYTHYTVYMSGDFSEVPLQLERKRPPAIKRGGSVLTSRFTVEEVGEGTYYGFVLDGDHLYMLDSFIVNHNTNVVLKAIGHCQRLYPDKTAVFVDAESGYDPEWAAQMGVDVEKLMVVHPEYAEQAVDMIEGFLYASDVSVVALDSIAALSTQNEIESSAEKMSVGGASLVIGKLFKKATVSFNRMRNQGQMPPAFIGINQIRHKIGVMFGDPECVTAGTLVNFVDGRSIPMKEVVSKKLAGPVWAFNEATNSFEPRMILSHHINGSAKDGELITLRTGGYDTVNGTMSATVSFTHKFLTASGWKRAGELTKSDLLVSRYRTRVNGTTLDFLRGAACGDLTLATRNRATGGHTTELRIQDSENPAYADWKASKLSAFTFSRIVTESGGVRHVSNASYSLTVFKGEVSGRSPIPLLSNFTWLGFSVWVMDDAHFQESHGRYFLAMGRYRTNPEMRAEISARLNLLGLDHKWKQDKQVVFTVSASKVIASNIAKYAPPCMQHKLPAEYRGQYEEFSLDHSEELVPVFVPIHEIGPSSKRQYRDPTYYDIHVEGLNNYSVGNMDNGFVVHNTMPGGNAIKFASSFTVRLYGKNVIDKKINPVMPAFKETNMVIKKWKMPILSTTGVFMMQMIAANGRTPGYVEDWNTVSNYLKELDYLSKAEKSGWVLFGDTYPTLDAVRTKLYSDIDTLEEAKAQIVQELLLKGGLGVTEGEEGADL